MNKKRYKASILAFLIILNIVIPGLYVFAENDVITISNKKDFTAFSKKCTLDSWSQDKTVNLTCDLNFSNTDLTPIPTFGGTFNGNGHTISGINFSKNGSYIGVFRYVQQGGKISNLNVQAEFIPNGSKNYIGGIVGENYGIIEQCSFNGKIKGENDIGGIAGSNKDSGQIILCCSDGSITGENSTGGIAGKNSGFILNCTNNAAVNTVYEEKKKDILNIETDEGAIVENQKIKSEENEEESDLGHSDTGGIMGYSSGIAQGCVNNGAVGYQHIGYNVGGIAGRQSGYMLGCENNGKIQGRKDVGGIVGQVEPYILLQASASGLENLQREINNLNSMVNRFITDTDNLTSDTKQHLTDISEYAKNARDNTEILLNAGTDFIDDNLSEINAQAAILSNTIDKLIPVFESLEDGCVDLSTALDDSAEALDAIKIYTPDLEKEIDDISDALSEISKAKKSIRKASARARRALNALDDAIEFNNQSNVKKAISDLFKSIQKINASNRNIKICLEDIATTLESKPESFTDIVINAERIIDNINEIASNLTSVINAIQTIEDSLNAIILNTEIDFSEFLSAAENAELAIEHLSDAMGYISSGLGDLKTAIDSASDKLEKYADDVAKQLNNAKNDLSDAITSLSDATDDIKTAIGDIKNIITDLSNEPPLEFVKLGDNSKTASENLFDSLSNISGKIDVLTDSLSNDKGTINRNLTFVANQFNLVMNMMINELDALQSDSNGISDIFLDVSDEDIANTRQGKVQECYNYATVSADRNTGGITGAMAIEYSSDPEDDIEKPNTFNFTYRTKAILQDCINDGKINGKKDCVGGIVGLSEIGTVYECENYGDVKSTNGNYAGGIAGKSESAIRRSYAKNKLTAQRYVGGIAGKADIVTSCYSIVNVSGDENTGAICGDVESKDNIYQNFYIDKGLGAIDGISYNGKAESVTFDEIKNVSGIPARFISFTVTFIADNKIVETQAIKYGDDTAGIEYPKIPEKDGCFGTWQSIEPETVTENIEVVCEYKPYITIISSEEKNENGKLALALSEGEFTDKSELHIKDSTQKPPVKADENVKVYDISLLNTDIKSGDTVKLRLLNENKDKVTAWVLQDSSWEKVKTGNKGKYATLKITGAENTLCLKYTKSGFSWVWVLLAFFAAAAIVIGVIKKNSNRIGRKE